MTEAEALDILTRARIPKRKNGLVKPWSDAQLIVILNNCTQTIMPSIDAAAFEAELLEAA